MFNRQASQYAGGPSVTTASGATGRPFGGAKAKAAIGALVAATLPLVAPAVVAQSRRISDDVVRIGVLTDMSSVSADNAGTGSVLAARLAIQDYSTDGKVLGKPIDLVS
ncbi:MAG: ABC transporter substrate-binding protein, partial [Burkholderiaceae bacterium]